MSEPRLEDWVGRRESRVDRITPAPLAALAATLDLPEVPKLAAGAIAPLWHWLYFLPLARASELGTDGHPRRGGFLPPVPLPRRMWAGGRLRFDAPLRVGDDVVRDSRILSVERKHGKSGALVFVVVRHEFRVGGVTCLSEEHDIVYRDNPPTPPEGSGSTAGTAAGAAAVPAGAAAPTDETFSRRVEPDPVLLFRYSALTFNGHRIHYDRSYVTGVEGYPGLIVHGPLIATMLAELARSQAPDATMRSFEFRASNPIFDIHPFAVCGKPVAVDAAVDGDARVAFDLWARDHRGALAMRARAVFHA
ncbi:MAG: MaoC family dehydratase N-terminal domain-containing protein [Lautropia sp.]